MNEATPLRTGFIEPQSSSASNEADAASSVPPLMKNGAAHEVAIMANDLNLLNMEHGSLNLGAIVGTQISSDWA